MIFGTLVENSTVHIILPENTSVLYFGEYYNIIYLHPEGILAFDSRVKYNPDRMYKDPQKPWTSSDDYPFIAPIMIKKSQIASSMSFNIHLSSNKSSQEFLDNLGDVISESFVGIQSVSLIFAVSVTWYDTERTCNSREMCQITNHSLILAVDGQQTFAVMEFNDTTPLHNVTFQSGFNFGYGRGWFDFGASSESLTGRNFYLVNSERPIKGGCDKNRNKKEGKAFISPRVLDMFGGNIVEVQGPCFYENDIIKLVVGNISNPYGTGDCYRVSEIKARCTIPPLTARGRVTVGISLNDISTMYTTTITVVHPTLTKRFVKLEGSGWGGTSAGELTVRWNATKLSIYPDARADVFIVGYSEKAFWDFHLPLVDDVLVSEGSATFNSDDISCGVTCAEYEAGFIAVKVKNITHANLYRTLTSGAMPFGWLMRKHLKKVHGPQWLHEKCMNWYKKEVKDMQWIEALDPCPCSLQQALLDMGRWQTDLSCNMFSKTPTCAFHKGAVHCVRSVGTIKKAGNQCCYGADGLLRYSEDTFQGSTPDRYHDWGAIPYGTSGSVPSLSHGLADVMTFFYCCIWANYKDCDFYMDVRPTTDCKTYKPPQQAMVFGQSHIITFDGQTGLVCEEGDYHLYQDSQMTVHGRFHENSQSQPSIKSKVLTSVGVKVKNETVIIKLKSGGFRESVHLKNNHQSERILDVTVNNEYQFFDREDNKWQDFNELTVVNNDEDSVQSNFTILSKHGVGVLVSGSTGFLHVTVTSLPALTEKSQGLLKGSKDSARGSVNGSDANYDIQFSWILQWYINDTLKQIIPYRVENDKSDIKCPKVLRNFTSEICHGDVRCLYDLFTTEDDQKARRTWMTGQRYSASMAAFSKVHSCGLLSVPRSTKSNVNYTLGNTVKITGCREGTLHGHTKYTCTNAGTSLEWVPSVTASCHQDSTAKTSDLGTSSLAGVVASVVIILIIIVVIAVVIIQRRKREDRYAFHRNYDSSLAKTIG
ncbi:sushi domain-containing protein 2-like [Saccostrea echinata]|uniref:sushi domain-containing protein 2-like n=1 Tax=Saccostrea echinata TaxID=191078 RepID=UPI002A825F9C|nr:sushi domain-containing protein 2-like [Saccostrea echinata]